LLLGESIPDIQKLVDLLDERQLLVEREVAGELVAPIGDVEHRRRLERARRRVHLDHPELVEGAVEKIAHRRIL
jgi:hypothetical protein